MLNARMFALAAAMLLSPIAYGWAQDVWDPSAIWDEPEDYVEYSSRVTAWVENVTLADPPEPYRFGDWELAPEQLVEGHTTFVTIERFPVEVVREGNLNVTGYLDCRAVADMNYTLWLGFVPVPRRVNGVGADCGDGARVVITPGLAATSAAGPLVSTGTLIPFETPDGQRAYAEELVFTVTEELPDGSLGTRDYYAWATPVFPGWVHRDGTIKNFWAPLPWDRLREMGVEDFEITLESELRR